MTSTKPVGLSLFKTTWVKCNRLQTGLGRFYSSMLKWGLAPSQNCKQSTDYVQIVCLMHQAPHGTQGLTVLDDETNAGSTPSQPASDPAVQLVKK